MISINRFSDLERWKMVGPWILVYGRRKTGKTYFVKNYTRYDKYFFVSRGREIFIDDDMISYDAFIRELYNDLKSGKTIVVDEFQRLPDDFSDRLHNLGVQGKLTLISSTLRLVEKYFGSRSPLLGLLTGFKMSLVDERDILKNMMNYIMDYKKLIEYSVYLREPWLIPLWESSREQFFGAILNSLKISVPALIGEIFTEEDRELSLVYESVLRSIASGRRVSGEIASYLYSNHVIPAQNPSLIHPYLNILVDLGILERVKIYGKRKYYYYLVSPLMDLYYYLDSKYGFADREIPMKQLNKVFKEKLPIHIEQFIGNLMAKMFGLYRERIIGKDYEVDIALTDFKKLKVVAEVKWRRRIKLYEMKKIEDDLSRFNCRKILIVPDKNIVEKRMSDIEIWDVKTILENIKR